MSKCAYHKTTECNDDGACPECGWRPANRGKNGPDDGRCVLRHDGIRCSFPAVWTEGRGRALWCYWHADISNRGHGPTQDIWFSINCKDADCIRDTLVERYGAKDWRDLMVDELVADHPEWTRGELETKSAYTGRMGEILNVVGRARRRQDETA